MVIHPLLDFLRRLRSSDQTRSTPDAELLTRFSGSRDEAAFTTLVQRHGPMVYRLCVRVLDDSPDVEDAFQATFIVLARRASTVPRPELLGSWLYEVAYRTALKLRAKAARRRACVREERTVDHANPAEEAVRREVRQRLDAELSRLPDRYRIPLVLHYLEGLTQEEVGKLLGCPRSTITTRLARACERLRGRLTRRGLTLSSAGLLAALAEEASAALPATLLDTTVKAARLFLAGGSALGTETAVALTEGVLQAMFLTKVKIALVCVLVLGAVATGAGILASGMQRPVEAAQDQSERPGDDYRRAEAPQPDKNLSKKDDVPPLAGLPAHFILILFGDLQPGRINPLLKEQYQVAREEAEGRWRVIHTAKAAEFGSLNSVLVQNCLAGFRDLLQAELDLCRIRGDVLSVLEGQVKRTKDLQAICQTKYDRGGIDITTFNLARFNRIRAEIWLERYKANGKLPADAPALPR
jgi:RNA polymerase sigma factor (sigma-70 family)